MFLSPLQFFIYVIHSSLPPICAILLFPSPVAVPLLLLSVAAVQFSITVLLTIGAICQKLGVAVSPAVTNALC
jgi:hypothetical protein